MRLQVAQVALDTAWLLAADAAGPGLDTIRERYREALREAGFTRGHRHVRLPALRKALTAYYAADFLEAVGCAAADGSGEDWVARATRPIDTALHPLHHLLLAQFFGITQDELLRPVSRGPCTSPDGGPLGGASTGNLAGRSADDRAREPTDVAVGCSFGDWDASDARGTAVPSVAERGTGAVVPPIMHLTTRRIRGQKLGVRTPTWEAELRRLVGNETVTQREAARRLGVEPITVKRHAWLLGVWRASWCMHQEVLPKTRMREQTTARRGWARAEYTRVRRAHPEMSRSALEALAPHAVQWLRRRDKAWFDARQPPRQYSPPRTPRVDWSARDAELAARIDGAAAELRAVERPKRITATRIFCRLDCADLQGELDRLPQTRARIEQHAESGEAFADRRLEWAAARCRAELRVPCLSGLLARAALRSGDRRRLRARALELVADLAQDRPAGAPAVAA